MKTARSLEEATLPEATCNLPTAGRNEILAQALPRSKQEARYQFGPFQFGHSQQPQNWLQPPHTPCSLLNAILLGENGLFLGPELISRTSIIYLCQEKKIETLKGRLGRIERTEKSARRGNQRQDDLSIKMIGRFEHNKQLNKTGHHKSTLK